MNDSIKTKIDPITLEVIRHGFISICDQIDANVTRTAFSPYIYVYKDYAVGFDGAEGELLAQSTGGMPVFVTDSVGMAVRDGLAVYGRENIHKGDVIVCNHAAVQGQHLNNTVMYTPVFAGPRGDDLIGFFAVNCHWIDIGGSAIGSVSYSSTDIFRWKACSCARSRSGPRASPSKKSIGSSRTTRVFADPLRDPDDGDLVGYQALYAGDGAITRDGDPATLLLKASQREALTGDRLVANDLNVPLEFAPRPPPKPIDGTIMAVLDGVYQIAQYQVVVINRGARDGLEPGHVLTVWQVGEKVRDTHDFGLLPKKVRLPDERTGVSMVFRTYDRISYALIMEATSEIHVLDKVRNPS